MSKHMELFKQLQEWMSNAQAEVTSLHATLNPEPWTLCTRLSWTYT